MLFSFRKSAPAWNPLFKRTQPNPNQFFFKGSKMTNHWPLQPHTHFSLNCSLDLISRERENKRANAWKQPRVPWGYNNWGRNILNYTLGQNDFRLIRNQNYPWVPVDCLCLEFIWRLRFSSSPHYHYYEECVYIDPVILSSRGEKKGPLNLKNPPVEGSAPAAEMCIDCFYPLTKNQVPHRPWCGAPVPPEGPQASPLGPRWLLCSSPGHPRREFCSRRVSPCGTLKRAEV